MRFTAALYYVEVPMEEQLLHLHQLGARERDLKTLIEKFKANTNLIILLSEKRFNRIQIEYICFEVTALHDM